MTSESWILIGAISLVFGLAGGGSVTWAAPGSANRIELPEPDREGSVTVEEALHRRRSVRTFAPRPLSMAEVSQLLWAAQGVTHPDGRRTAPSAGALYPLEIFLVAGRIEGLEAGVYRYLPHGHQLERRRAEDRRPELQSAALDQACVGGGPAVIVIAGVEERTAKKYGSRAKRYVQMEAGFAGENIALQATGLGLGTVIVGAFEDGAVQQVLGLEPQERPLCLIPLGHRR